MKLQRTFQGLEIDLRSGGRGRFGGALFLTIWLLFWIAGESVALLALGRGLWSLLTGGPFLSNGAPLTLGAALAGGAFLSFWTAFWTLGGYLAGRELLRLLFGRDLLVARTETLETTNDYGLFRSRRQFPAAQLIRFYIPLSGAQLAVETRNGTEILSRHNRHRDLEESVRSLNEFYRLPAQTAATGILPNAWRETTTPEGRSVLVRNPVNQQRLGRILWIIFAVAAGAAVLLVVSAFATPANAAIAAIFGTIAFLLGWGAWRVSTQRDEWVLQPGGISLDQRSRHGVTRLYTGDRVRLRESRDSDGDPWFKLVAANSETSGAGGEKTIEQRSADPTELLSFGRWLEKRCRITFEDLTTAEAKADEFEQIRAKLAGTGRFGAWAARLLSKTISDARR